MAAAEGNIEKEVSVTPIVSLPLPTPYEYALISKAAYADTLPAINSPLSKLGWKRSKAIFDENGYCGSLWIHEANKQIVIAHRGSQNLSSWMTDIESVMQLKPGGFITKAIELMKETKELAPQGYRISTTGHSLGGFLAQVCVYWANRSDFPETFYPDMSAMVFDSPGAKDFLEVIQPNIASEQRRIDLDHLKIHNFCAMPTAVSTYGTPTGSIWHIANSEACFLDYDALTTHMMSEILQGFNPETGQPYYFRFMRDWPKADYSMYQDFAMSSDIKTAAKRLAIKTTLDCLNWLYKRIKEKVGYTLTPTFYDQICTREGQVSAYLQQTKASGRRPELSEFNKRLAFALRAHYSALPLERDSKERMDIHHFDAHVQQFLEELNLARSLDNPLDWEKFLQEQYGQEGYDLLQKCHIERDGEKVEIVLDNYESSVFDFQRKLYILLNQRQTVSFKSFFSRKVSEIQKRLESVETGSEALKNQLKQIQVLQNKWANPSHHLASTVKSTVANFMPREQILSDLKNAFTVWSNGGAVALLGPRGAGKTQMARYWCHEHMLKNTQNGLVLELNASSTDILLSEYKKLGTQLGIQWEDKVSPEDICARVQHALLCLEHDVITILFDNAPDYDTVKPYLLPASSKKPVYSLITSYNSTNFTNANEIKTIPVKPEFTPMETKQYIKNTLHEKIGVEVSEPEAEKLATLVYYHPLALTQALNYIVQGSTIVEFCKKYERYKPIALKKGLTGDYNESILTITHFAVEKLSKPAKDLLYFCSFLHPTDIPKSLLQRFVGEDNIEQLSSIMDELQAFSLLSRCKDVFENTTVSYEFHGLVQEVVREHILMQPMKKGIAIKTIMVIIKEYSEKNLRMEDMQRCIQLIPHMEAILRYSDELFSDSGEEKQLPLLVHLAQMYNELGDATKAKELLERVLPKLEIYYGNDHPQMARILNDLATAYSELGNAAKAKELLVRALSILENHDGEEYFELVQILENLANAYSELGDAIKGKELLEHILPILETRYGKDHLRMVEALINLANTYSELGDIIKAKELLERALPILEASYGKEHWKVAITLNNLANACNELGDATKAKELLERALPISETHYGKEHQQVAMVLNSLANVYDNLGDATKAKELWERALPILEVRYGRDHWQVAMVLTNLGSVYNRLGNVAMAKILLERALAIKEAYYGNDHLHVVTTLIILATTYKSLGEMARAKILLERALSIQEIHYGQEHPQLIRTLLTLIDVYFALGDKIKTKALLERVLPILERHSGNKHPTVAITLNNLGHAKIALGDKKGACEAFNKAYTIFLYNFGHNNSYTRGVKSNLDKYCSPSFWEWLFGSTEAQENIDPELAMMSFDGQKVESFLKNKQEYKLDAVVPWTLAAIGLNGMLYNGYYYGNKETKNTWNTSTTSVNQNHTMTPVLFPALRHDTTISAQDSKDSILQPQRFFSYRARSAVIPARLPNLIGVGRVGIVSAAIGITFYGGWQAMQRYTQSQISRDTEALTSIEPKIRKNS